ncbi:hypothetical protein Sm713_56980 [Streptomyces sp. TS71-3]|nr:hypothetical protein Sm713_56980 [Streptomyces sp. TS71-3]
MPFATDAEETSTAADTEEVITSCAKRLSYSDARQLVRAIDGGQPITVEYVAASGNRTVRAVSRWRSTCLTWKPGVTCGTPNASSRSPVPMASCRSSAHA